MAGSAASSRGIEPLVAHLERRIAREGPLSFASFMEEALYHPEHGYYTCGRPAGARDFRTSPQVHPVFGALLARQGRQMHRLLGEPATFRWVEIGPGDGSLAAALIVCLDDWPSAWSYHLVETSPALRRAQEERLGALPASLRARIHWSDAEALSRRPADGLVLSNEFFDALPVHRVRRTAAGLREVRVTATPDAGFHELLVEASPELRRALERYGAPMPEGSTAEIGLAALAWVDRIAGMLRRGYAVTIDYGDRAEGLFLGRPAGTVMAYRGHRPSPDPYRQVGEQDLTAHVNFTALIRRGEAAGLVAAPLRSQTEFLLGLGILDRLARLEGETLDEPERWRQRLAIKDLFAPEGMGEAFRVLVQARDAPLDGLAGLSSPWREGCLDRGSRQS